MQLTKTVIGTALGEEVTGHMDSGSGRTRGFRVLRDRYGAAVGPGTGRPGQIGGRCSARRWRLVSSGLRLIPWFADTG
jgi:hypothetical protein